jgi:hypothetical protein
MNDKLSELEARIDAHLREFSLVGIGIGAGLHVGANHTVKKMLKPGSWQQRMGSSIFQKGVRHAREGKAISPWILRASDVALGPEPSHLYRHGLDSTRKQRLTAAVGKKFASDNPAAGLSHIVSGKRSKWTDRILDKLPKSPIEKVRNINKSVSGYVGGAATAVATGLVDPIVPAINATRTAIAESPLGARFLKKKMRQGLKSGPSKGVAARIQDYLVSPSINIARDLGAQGRKWKHLAPESWRK